MLQACQIYTAVIQPSLTYEVIAWHHLQLLQKTSAKPTSAGITGKLAKQQNKCICLIAGVYKATLTSTVETEVFIPPLDLHLDSVIARAVKRMAENGMACQIETVCTVIRRKLHYQNQN